MRILSKLANWCALEPEFLQTATTSSLSTKMTWDRVETRGLFACVDLNGCFIPINKYVNVSSTSLLHDWLERNLIKQKHCKRLTASWNRKTRFFGKREQWVKAEIKTVIFFRTEAGKRKVNDSCPIIAVILLFCWLFRWFYPVKFMRSWRAVYET